MLKYIPEASKRTSPYQAVVVLESDSPDELNSSAAKSAAIEKAGSLGIGSPCGVSNTSGPYIPMRNGQPAMTVEDMEALQKEMVMYGPHHKMTYRNEYTLLRPTL